MEVGRLGQGGPINIDYTVRREGSSEVPVTPVAIKAPGNISKSAENPQSEQDNPTKEDVTKAVDKLNKFLEGEKVHAEYEFHEKFGDLMIKIIDNTTKEVLLEVPPRKILDMVAKMLETVGILLDEKA